MSSHTGVQACVAWGAPHCLPPAWSRWSSSRPSPEARTAQTPTERTSVGRRTPTGGRSVQPSMCYPLLTSSWFDPFGPQGGPASLLSHISVGLGPHRVTSLLCGGCPELEDLRSAHEASSGCGPLIARRGRVLLRFSLRIISGPLSSYIGHHRSLSGTSQ